MIFSKKNINIKYLKYKDTLDNIILKFDSKIYKSIKRDRNTLKIFDLKKKKIVVKSFKVPNILNKIIYTFFRKSKAKRSYEYALKLVTNNINTPKPIAYYETKKYFLLNKSYYVCEHIDYDIDARVARPPAAKLPPPCPPVPQGPGPRAHALWYMGRVECKSTFSSV